MGALSLTKEARRDDGADGLFSKLVLGNWTATCKRMRSEHSLTPHTKTNSKWIKDLNVRPETVKLLEENIGRALYDINHSKILYDPPPRVMEVKTKINKWDLLKLKSSCTEKGGNFDDSSHHPEKQTRSNVEGEVS